MCCRSRRDCVLTKFSSQGEYTTIDVLGCGSSWLTIAERTFLVRVMYHISHTNEYGGATNVVHVGTDNVHQALLTKYIKWSTIIIKIVKCDNNFSLRIWNSTCVTKTTLQHFCVKLIPKYYKQRNVVQYSIKWVFLQLVFFFFVKGICLRQITAGITYRKIKW